MTQFHTTNSCTLRSVLYLASTLYFLIGGGALGAALYFWFNGTAQGYAFDQRVLIAAMAIGSFLMVTGMVGCGSIKSRGALRVYTLFLILLVIAQVVLGVLMYRGQISPEQSLSNVWDYISPENRLSIQNQNNCCGFQSPADRPQSSDTCSARASLPGCYTALEQQYQNNLKYAWITLFSVAGVQVLTLVVAFSVLFCGNKPYDDTTASKPSTVMTGVSAGPGAGSSSNLAYI